MGVGKSGDGEWMGVGWNWKMGMISDCYQLQENQRKNGPLTVKTPPPCTGSPPAWWMQGGRWWAHCLRLILRRCTPFLRPSLCHASRRPCEFQQGKKPSKPLRRKASRQMLKRYKFQHSPGEGRAQVVQVGRIMQAVKMGQGVPLVLVSLLPFLPF